MSSWYSWAFDGVAGGALVAIGVILYQRYSINSTGKLSVGADSRLPSSPGQTEPTPEQILNDIQSVLPFDRDTARQKYVGLDVVWRTSLLALNKSDDRYFVVTRFGKGNAVISVNFSMSMVPSELSSATQHSTLLLKGTIRSVGGFSGDIELELDPEVRVIKRA